MESIAEYLNVTVIPPHEMAIRIGLAALFGFLIGFDRDRKNKPIGFRPYMIVCVTTVILAITGTELQAQFYTNENVASVDLAKVISGVVTGIGFLGAGAIFRSNGGGVVGMATGASIWAAGGIGLALGFGFYLLSIMGFLAIAIILIAGGWLQRPIHGEDDVEDPKDG